jgi:RNA polymerase sigma-70 factor (ECF subfamily)
MSVGSQESQLTTRASLGDKEAFGDLYELYLDELFRYVFYRISNKADAEDLTELVFLKAWEGLPGYRGTVPFRAWLYRIARNAIVDHYRTRKQNVPLDEDVPLADTEDHPEQQVLFQETTEQLIDAISMLSPLHQDVLVLRFVNGYSTAETAQILERNVGTVRVLQHRALKAMQANLVAENIVNG